MHYEPGVTVSRTFAPSGDVVSSQTSGWSRSQAHSHRPFDQLPQAWPALFAWCKAQGLELEGGVLAGLWANCG